VSILPPTADRRQITGPPFITCVDLDGFQVPRTELWDGPSEEIDPTHPASWPAWTDNFFWEVSDDERAALEAEALEAECDRRDAVDAPGNRPWLTLMWSGPLPPSSQVSDDELGMMGAGLPIG
jgi:hypothetical protein